MRIQMILLTCFMALGLLLTGCQRKPAALPPLGNLGFDTWEEIFDQAAAELVQSRSDQDPALLSPELLEHVFYYSLTGPDYTARLHATYLSRHGGVVVAKAWNGEPLPTRESWTEGHPLTEYHQISVAGGEIVSWQMLFGQEFHNAAGLELNRGLLQDYAAAWSSGKAGIVANLYTPEAVRNEALLWGDRAGNAAIKQLAGDFFTQYPGARVELLQAFGEVPEAKRIGGEFAIRLPRSWGRTCDIQALVVLQPDGSQIAEEWVYFQADSLRDCGWIR